MDEPANARKRSQGESDVDDDCRVTLLKKSASKASASVLRKGREDVAPHTHHIWLPASDTMPLHGGVNSGPRKHRRRGRRVARRAHDVARHRTIREQEGEEEAAARRVVNAAREHTRREQEGEEEAAARREIGAARHRAVRLAPRDMHTPDDDSALVEADLRALPRAGQHDGGEMEWPPPPLTQEQIAASVGCYRELISDEVLRRETCAVCLEEVFASNTHSLQPRDVPNLPVVDALKHKVAACTCSMPYPQGRNY